ncbi:MAG: carboxypeptidase-like regulatory domain-containing protein, partial [Ferruginibacter sp.]
MRLLSALVLSLLFFYSSAQKKTAFVSGNVIDDNGDAIAKVSVVILGKTAGIITNDSGYFRIQVPAERSLALIFSHTGYAETQKNFYLSENEEEKVTVRMDRVGKVLETVVVSDERERKEAGITKINPRNALVLPSTTGGIEGLIKILVGSNNELTSQYSVRGGNYDENLIYINDFEIFRPYLVRSGQQEGLSFINPELARNVSFYNGGFQAKYGDKMSSVLDIQYKKPKSFGGSAYVSLLEQGFHLEAASKNERLTFLMGVRNRSNRNLLSSQEVQGTYIPSSNDLQVYLTYKLTEKLQLELLGNFSSTKFTLFPESAQKTTSVFSPLFTANLGLDIFFEGQERTGYKTGMVGLSAIYQATKKLRLKGMLSRFKNEEKENFDIAGA